MDLHTYSICRQCLCGTQWCNGQHTGLVIERLWVPLSCYDSGKLFTRMCLFLPSSISWYRPKAGDALQLGT